MKRKGKRQLIACMLIVCSLLGPLIAAGAEGHVGAVGFIAEHEAVHQTGTGALSAPALISDPKDWDIQTLAAGEGLPGAGGDDGGDAARESQGVRPRPASLVRQKDTSLPLRGAAVPEPGSQGLSLGLVDVALGYVSAGDEVSLPIAARLGLGDEDVWVSDDMEMPDGISMLRVSLDPEQLQSDDFPFALADASDDAAVEKTIVADGVNHGTALFDGLVVKDGVSAGSHPVLFNITWSAADSDIPQEMTLLSDVVLVRVQAQCECCEHCVLCYDQQTGERLGDVCACVDANGNYLGCHCECPFLIDPDDPNSGWTDCGCDCRVFTASPDVTAKPQEASYIGNYGPGVLVHTFQELRDAITDRSVADESRAADDPARYRNLYASGDGSRTRTIYLGFNPAHQPADGDASFPNTPTLQNVFVPDGEEGIAVPQMVDHLILVGTVNGMRVTVSDWGTRGPGVTGRQHTIHNEAGRAGQRLTLVDANLRGENPWGLFGATDADTPVVHEYVGVDFTGRQMGTNDTGAEGGIILDDVSAKLVSTADEGDADGALAFIEADVCTIRGEVAVQAEAPGDRTGLWTSRPGGMLRVEAGAGLTVQAQGRRLIGGQADGFTLRLEDGAQSAAARLVLRAGSGVSEHPLGSVYIGSGAVMQINPENAETDVLASMLSCEKEITIEGELAVEYNRGTETYGGAAIRTNGRLRVGTQGRLVVRYSGGGNTSPVQAQSVLVAGDASGGGTLAIDYAPTRGVESAVRAQRAIHTQGASQLEIVMQGQGSAAALEAPIVQALGGVSITMESGGPALLASEQVRADSLRIVSRATAAHVIDAPQVRFGAGQVFIEAHGGESTASVVHTQALRVDPGAVVSIVQHAGGDMLHAHDGGTIAIGGRLTAMKMAGASGAMLRAGAIDIGGESQSAAQVRLIQQDGGDTIDTGRDGRLAIWGAETLLYVHKAGGTDSVLNGAEVHAQGILQILQEDGDTVLRNTRAFVAGEGASVDIARNLSRRDAVFSFAPGASGKELTLDSPSFVSIRNANGPLVDQAEGAVIRGTVSAMNYRSGDAWRVWNHNMVSPYTFEARVAGGTVAQVTTTLEDGVGANPGGVPMNAQTFDLHAPAFQELRTATFAPVQMQAVQADETGVIGTALGASRVAGYEYIAQSGSGYMNRYNSTGWETAGGSEGFALSFPEPMLSGSRVYLVLERDEQVNGQKFVVQAYAYETVRTKVAQEETDASLTMVVNLSEILGLDVLSAGGSSDSDAWRLSVRVLSGQAQTRFQSQWTQPPESTETDSLVTLKDHQTPLASPESNAAEPQPDRLILFWTLLL